MERKWYISASLPDLKRKWKQNLICCFFSMFFLETNTRPRITQTQHYHRLVLTSQLHWRKKSLNWSLGEGKRINLTKSLGCNLALEPGLLREAFMRFFINQLLIQIQTCSPSSYDPAGYKQNKTKRIKSFEGGSFVKISRGFKQKIFVYLCRQKKIESHTQSFFEESGCNTVRINLPSYTSLKTKLRLLD